MPRLFALICVLTGLLSMSAFAQDGQQGRCAGILKAHGFLSRAQFQCAFGYYSNAMIESARACAKNLAEAEAKQLLLQGMQTFDLDEKERGHAALCAQVLRDFSGMVRK